MNFISSHFNALINIHITAFHESYLLFTLIVMLDIIFVCSILFIIKDYSNWFKIRRMPTIICDVVVTDIKKSERSHIYHLNVGMVLVPNIIKTTSYYAIVETELNGQKKQFEAPISTAFYEQLQTSVDHKFDVFKAKFYCESQDTFHFAGFIND